MATVRALGPCKADGGCLVVCIATPNTGIAWRASAGSITSLADATDAAGVAFAKYNPSGTSAGVTVTLTADLYA